MLMGFVLIFVTSLGSGAVYFNDMDHCKAAEDAIKHWPEAHTECAYRGPVLPPPK